MCATRSSAPVGVGCKFKHFGRLQVAGDIKRVPTGGGYFRVRRVEGDKGQLDLGASTNRGTYSDLLIFTINFGLLSVSNERLFAL